MNEIQIFQNAEFGAIRTMSNAQGEPMFCAKDVALALGYKRPEDAMAQHLEIEDSVKHRVMDRNGKLRVTTFINESGLYSLILSSKLESAKQFKRWVTGEVLPAIRKQGGYLMAKQGESEKDIMIRALEIVQTTLQRRDEEIARLQPKADYTDHVLDSVTCITTTQLAKELDESLLCEDEYGEW